MWIHYPQAPTKTTAYYYLLNLQGDVLRLVDKNSVTVASYDYDPYGNILSATGTLATTNPLRYRGYYYDAETGFYYLQSRYYDPQIGRFINADGYASTGQGFLGYNMFAYCNNNPIMGLDPHGTWDWGGVLTGLAMVAVGVVSIVATVASCGTATPLAAGVVTLALAETATGIAVTEAAATDSAVVVDLSVSVGYQRVGLCHVTDYGTHTSETYTYAGYTRDGCLGATYATGTVGNYKKPGDYSGDFMDVGTTLHTYGGVKIGISYAQDPQKKPSRSCRAACITFSFGKTPSVGYADYRLIDTRGF